MNDLDTLIDWPHVMSQPRYAGGHEEVMRSIFGCASEVIAWWHEGGYQGTIAIAHKLRDGRVVVMTDYYGSCSGCDAWDCADDETARTLVLNLVHSARIFDSVKTAHDWCAAVDTDKTPSDYPFSEAVNLVGDLRRYQEAHQ